MRLNPLRDYELVIQKLNALVSVQIAHLAAEEFH